MSGLEARYRRILMVLPRAYRQRRAEEMLTTLLDGADEGRRWPRVGEVASVAGLAVRLRAGAPGGSLRARFGGRVLRRIGVAGLVIQALLYVRDPTLFVYLGVRYGYWPSLGLAAHHVRLLADWVLIYSSVVLPLAALAALLYGWRRTGRVLACGPCVLATAALATNANFGGDAGYVALAGLSYLVAGAVMLGFPRDAPVPAHRGMWLGLVCGLLAVAAATVFAAAHVVFGADPAGASAMTALRLESFVLSPLGPTSVVVAGLVCARKSAVWPAALFALGLPLLLIVPRDYRLVTHGRPQYAMLDDLMSGAWPGFGLECLGAEAVLGGVLLWSLSRHRSRRAGDGESQLAAAD